MARYDRVENLRMITEVVARMSQNDFLIRGWAVTIVTVLGAIAVGQAAQVLLLLCVVPILLFWLLGGYYLHIERSFKRLFETVAQSRTQRIYSMDAKQYRTVRSYLGSLFAPHQVVFYLALLLPVIAVYLFVPLQSKPSG